jgi:hypothetical protein
VRLKQLAEEPLLLHDREYAALAFDKILQLYSAAGVTPNVVTLHAEPGEQASMLAVASGDGICLALRSQLTRSYVTVNGVDPKTVADLYRFDWRDGSSEAALAALHGVSFTATIGFVALIGIEIKTSILLVDLTNQMRAHGVPVGEAIRKAGEIRFLPIVLTSMTAIGGLLPIAVQGSAMYAPLAWVIIGGLVSSTLLARIVTPVMYQLITPEV